MFSTLKGTGLIGRFRRALADAANLSELAEKVEAALSKGGKAEFAMDLLCSDEMGNIKVPAYIDEGLLWLSEALRRKEADVLGKGLSAPKTEHALTTQDYLAASHAAGQVA